MLTILGNWFSLGALLTDYRPAAASPVRSRNHTDDADRP
jgi:hypothetical protein